MCRHRRSCTLTRPHASARPVPARGLLVEGCRLQGAGGCGRGHQGSGCACGLWLERDSVPPCSPCSPRAPADDGSQHAQHLRAHRRTQAGPHALRTMRGACASQAQGQEREKRRTPAWTDRILWRAPASLRQVQNPQPWPLDSHWNPVLCCVCLRARLHAFLPCTCSTLCCSPCALGA